MDASDKYPLAVVIGYGPDDKLATKVVASIFTAPGQQEPAAMEKWTVEKGDIRQDSAAMTSLAHFLKRHRAVKNASYNWGWGCPHEEGIDYPEGEDCPHCPFWANLDRHTLEPKSLDRPSSPEQLLAGLARERTEQPLLVFEAVDRHRREMVEPLLRAVESVLNDCGGASAEDLRVFSYGLAFLTKWREPRAFPLVIRWLSLPTHQAFDIGGDTVTHWGPRMLATLCGGNVEAIKSLILDRKADEFCRSEAIQALVALVAWNERSRVEVVDYLGWLVRAGLEREPSVIWDGLVEACANLGAIGALDDLREAAEQDLFDPLFLEIELERVNAEGTELILAELREFLTPFDDVAKESEWWECFSNEEPDFEPGFESMIEDDQAIDPDFLLPEDLEPPPYREPVVDLPPQPYVAPPKTGRNEPCPCGSGKKYKKCCGA
jgi:hypothetical protein